MQIQNSFIVAAPMAQAWEILIDVPRIAPCLPGAEITEVVDARHFKGRARVKVGPVQLAFAGEAVLEELDNNAYRARVKAKGSDTKGRGAAQADLGFRLVPEGAATKVEIDTQLQLTGAVAQYGRAQGLIKEIASQLTQQFANNLQRQMGVGAVGDQAAPAAPARGPAPEPTAPPAGDSTAAPTPAKPISGLGLLFRALGAMIARWLGNLFGSGSGKR